MIKAFLYLFSEAAFVLKQPIDIEPAYQIKGTIIIKMLDGTSFPENAPTSTVVVINKMNKPKALRKYLRFIFNI